MKERKLAVFDFDGTLIKGDSLWPFFIAVAGKLAAFSALAEALVCFAICHYKRSPATIAPEMRTFIKTHLLRRLLQGRKLSSLGRGIEKVRQWCKWNEDIRQKLLFHASQGHQIVIASGALNLYLPELLKEFPPHELLCTTMVAKNGVLSGEMASINCVRQGKADMLARYMAAEEPFTESWGYGNIPHDLPMFELLTHRIIVA